MRRLAANYVFPVSSPPIKNGILEISDEGEILNLINPGSSFKELRKVEFYNGVLVPGFVNCHCHLELSALRNYFSSKRGLPDFIKTIRKRKENLKPEEQYEAIKKADKEMQQNGIIAAGDISNTEGSFQVKKESNLYYHTFVEVYGHTKKEAAKNFSKALKIFDRLVHYYQLEGNLTPHAFYSVHPSLMQSLFKKQKTANPIYSIHNQETTRTNEHKIKKEGKFYYHLKNLEVFNAFFGKLSRKKPEEDFEMLPEEFRTLLVHNIFTSSEDIDKAFSHFNNLYWVFCPGSNLFIESKLPDITRFIEKGQNITLGTDSLASNSALSILQEMKTIQKNFPEVKMDNLFSWATLNGARALGIDGFAGSFETGKKPGVNLIAEVDFLNWTIPERATQKTII